MRADDRSFCRSHRFGLAGLLGVALCLLHSGCINSMVMLGKVLLGDPIQPSAFEQATSISLKKEQKNLMVHCSAPFLVAEEYGSLTADIQEELIRRMRRRELQVVNSEQAARILDRKGGGFDAQLLARESEGVDYIMHIQIDRFSHTEEATPNLYRGQATGSIVGYEVKQDGEARNAVKVFDQRFHSTYPARYPIPVDQMSKSVFIRRFVEHVADNLGASFYDVSASSLIPD